MIRHFFVSVVMLYRCVETFPNEICFPKLSKEIPEALSSYFMCVCAQLCLTPQPQGL